MSVSAPHCTCDMREHACSPPCRAHPERGGGLGNPGWDWDLPSTVPQDPQAVEDERTTQAFFRKLRERREFDRALASAAKEYTPPPD